MFTLGRVGALDRAIMKDGYVYAIAEDVPAAQRIVAALNASGQEREVKNVKVFISKAGLGGVLHSGWQAVAPIDGDAVHAIDQFGEQMKVSVESMDGEERTPEGKVTIKVKDGPPFTVFLLVGRDTTYLFNEIDVRVEWGSDA
jgi:hypothetical protein